MFAQQYLGLPQGTIRATVLIETITAAFEMDEILYELREHSAGLNAGRWDYIFSVIKNFGQRDDFVLPDRVGGDDDRAVHARVHRTAGAHLPPARRARDRRHGRVHPDQGPADQRDGVRARCAPTRTARPATASTAPGSRTPAWSQVCRTAFDAVLGDRPNQIDRLRDDVRVTADDLLAVDAHAGPGHRRRVCGPTSSVALRYIDAWLGGTGAVALDDLMEDAATAEIARCQLWQWIHHGTPIADGGRVTVEHVQALIDAERPSCPGARQLAARLDAAARVLIENVLGDDLPAFFTTCAYAEHLLR